MKYNLEELRKKIKAKIAHDIKGIINEINNQHSNEEYSSNSKRNRSAQGFNKALRCK